MKVDFILLFGFFHELHLVLTIVSILGLEHSSFFLHDGCDYFLMQVVFQSILVSSLSVLLLERSLLFGGRFGRNQIIVCFSIMNMLLFILLFTLFTVQELSFFLLGVTMLPLLLFTALSVIPLVVLLLLRLPRTMRNFSLSFPVGAGTFLTTDDRSFVSVSSFFDNFTIFVKNHNKPLNMREVVS